MADHTGSWYPLTQQGVQWDASGNPYYNTSDGQHSYLPPIAAAQERSDPKLLAWAKSQGANVTYGPNDANGNPTVSDVRTGAPQGGFGGNYHWNSEQGGYDKDNFFDSSLGGLILGGAAVGGPIAFGAMAGGGAGAGATATTTGASASTAGASTTAGLLPSTTIGTGMVPAVTGGTGMAAGGGGMGFLSSLKTGLDLFNKGSSAVDALKGPSAANSLSTTAGKIEGGRASALVQQARLQQEQDQLAQLRAKLALEAPGMEAGNAVRGDLLANGQDAQITGLPSYIHKPTITGGLRPSMLSGNTRSLGANMSRQALLHNMTGDDVPNLTPLPESNAYDSVLQGVGTGAGFLDALGGMFHKPATPTTQQAGGGGYNGTGTPGYPGDATSPDNPMIPKPLDVDEIDQALGGTGGLDPEMLEYWKQQAMGGGA